MAVSVVDIQVNSQGAVRSLQQLNAAVKGVTATIGSLAAALGAGFALQQVIRTASEFESTLSDIGKTAGSSQKDILKLADSLKQLSMPGRTNLAPSVLAKGVQDLVAQGLKLDDAVASIETLGKVAVATNSDLTDVTKTGFQLQSALKIKPTELKETFDALAFAGKAGAFELKDMAQFMPTIASAATSIGITGKKGAVALAAMMQMVRKDAPGAAEASTRLTDALLKMTAPDAVKNFAKFGVNIEQVLKGAVAKGINPMDAALKELQRVTGGDAFKLSQIFGDKEAKLALMSLMKYREEYEKLKAAAGGAAAAGTVQADFEASLETFNGKLQTLQTSGEILALSLGNTLLPILARLIEEILPIVNGVAEFVKGIGQVPKPVIDAAIEIGKLVIQLTLVDKAIKIAMATAALFRGAMLLLATQTTLTGAAALTGQAKLLMLASGFKGAAGAAVPLLNTIKSLAAIGAIVITVDLIVKGIGDLIAATREIMRLRGIRAGGGAAAQFAGASRETVVNAQKQQKDILAGIKRSQKANKLNPGQKALQTILGGLSPLAGLPDIGQQVQRSQLYQEQAAFSQGVLGLDPNKFKPAVKPTPAPTPTPIPTGGTKPKKDTAAEKAANAAAKESERVAQVIRDRLAEGELLQVKSRLQDKISAAEISGDRMLGARLQGLQKEIDIQYQYAQALAQEKDVRAQQAIIFEGNSKLVANQRDTERELAAIQRQNEQDGLQAITAYLEKQYELNTAIQQQNALAESVSSTLGQGMTAVFDSLIKGSDNWGASLQQIASSVLVDIANQLIRIFVIEQAVSAIKSFLTPFNPATPLGAGGGMVGKFGTFGPNYGIRQRALGGPVTAGSPYLVGERGPELFTPKHGGSIIPNNALGGGSTNVVVNVDASGSSVQGDQAQSRQLGVAISAAVQAELVKQQRPGGLLATTRR